MAVVTCCRQSPLSPPKRSAPCRLRLAALQHTVVPMSVRLGPFSSMRPTWTKDGDLALVGPAADIGTAQIATFAKAGRLPVADIQPGSHIGRFEPFAVIEQRAALCVCSKSRTAVSGRQRPVDQRLPSGTYRPFTAGAKDITNERRSLSRRAPPNRTGPPLCYGSGGPIIENKRP